MEVIENTNTGFTTPYDRSNYEPEPRRNRFAPPHIIPTTPEQVSLVTGATEEEAATHLNTLPVDDSEADMRPIDY